MRTLSIAGKWRWGPLLAALLGTPIAFANATDLAAEILSATGVHGGLVVQLNCRDGALAAALRASDAYVVHGLARTSDELARARQTVRDQGLYGPVSVDLIHDDVLPCIDNSVNLLVCDGPPHVPEEEIMRVLVPRGVAYVRPSDQWTETTKPWPEDRDEWTHYLHDAGNNAVAHDTAIGPPRHLQWDGAPRYSRHHEFTLSVAAMASAPGRRFSIVDMGSRASIYMPPEWRLTARDAFNGIVLWERPIASWFNHLWPLTDEPAQRSWSPDRPTCWMRTKPSTGPATRMSWPGSSSRATTYAGRDGAPLMGLSAKDGRARFLFRLPALPVWDGLAVAEHRVFVSTQDGSVTCLAGRSRPSAAARQRPHLPLR
ncbi:MAG: hypothetical protein JSW27_22895 [Phycisphaerales bacterium]|nr:MAG: hypothetical protein JSW27_22895 [Phycisphaerales bacterium]